MAGSALLTAVARVRHLCFVDPLACETPRDQGLHDRKNTTRALSRLSLLGEAPTTLPVLSFTGATLKETSTAFHPYGDTVSWCCTRLPRRMQRRTIRGRC